MNIYYLKIAFNNFSRKSKKMFSNVFIVSLATILVISVLSITKSLEYFIKNNILNAITYRTILIDYPLQSDNLNDAKKKIETTENIIGVYPKINSCNVKVTNISESHEIYSDNKNLTLEAGNEATLPKLVKGRLIDTNGKFEAIIPKLFYPYDYEIGMSKENIKYLNGEDFIGKNITVEYCSYDYSGNSDPVITNKFNYTFRVVGVYDAVKNFNSPNAVYIPYIDLMNINNSIIENSKGASFPSNNEIIAVVNSYSNVESVIKKLNTLGYSAVVESLIGQINQMKNFIFLVGLIMIILVSIIGVINIALTVINTVKDTQKEIGLMKSIGYTNIHVILITLFEMFILSVISFVLTSVLISIIFPILNNYIHLNTSNYFNGFNLTIDYKIYILSSIISISIPLISSIFGIRHILKIQPSQALKL